ncbi:MAG: hypothetical protein MHM6MM_007897 [Cercozoa sp. M6MM]
MSEKWDRIVAQIEQDEERDKEEARLRSRERYEAAQEQRVEKWRQRQLAQGLSPEQVEKERVRLQHEASQHRCGLSAFHSLHQHQHEQHQQEQGQEQQQQLSEAEKRKLRIDTLVESRRVANAFFAEHEDEKALHVYERALLYCEAVEADLLLHGNSGMSESELETYRIALHANSAACLLRLNRLRQAIQQCEIVLRHDATHVKAHYRKAQALARLRDDEPALRAYDRAAAHCQDGTLRAQIARCASRLRARINKESLQRHQRAHRMRQKLCESSN